MNPIFFQIGSLKITYYGLCYAIAFFLGTEFLKKEAKKRGISKKLIEDIAFVGMISGLIGGRLYYVLFNYHYYFSYPEDIIAVWKGGMAIHGGIIGGFIGVVLYSYKKKFNPFILGDMVAPLLLLGQAIGRLGNLANGEVHGVPTFTPLKVIFTLKPSFYTWYNKYLLMPVAQKSKFKELVPWGIVFPKTSPAGMEFPNIPLHPAMLYECFLNLIGFIILFYLMKTKRYATGTIWWLYIIIYSLNRIFVSFFRAEDLMLFGFRAPHIVSFIMFVFAVVIIIIINNKNLLKE